MRLAIYVLICLLTTTTIGSAANHYSELSGSDDSTKLKVDLVVGKVMLLKSGAAKAQPLRVNSWIAVGDQITTGKVSLCTLTDGDRSYTISEKTKWEFLEKPKKLGFFAKIKNFFSNMFSSNNDIEIPSGTPGFSRGRPDGLTKPVYINDSNRHILTIWESNNRNGSSGYRTFKDDNGNEYIPSDEWNHLLKYYIQQQGE